MTKSTILPKSFRRIDRYVIIAPLLPDGRLDGEAWRAHRDVCRVVHTRQGDILVGQLMHGPGSQWRFQFEPAGGAGDEKGYRLGEERLQAGEYISILRDDAAHPYRVTAVTAL